MGSGSIAASFHSLLLFPSPATPGSGDLLLLHCPITLSSLTIAPHSWLSELTESQAAVLKDRAFSHQLTQSRRTKG